jgi:hypothetical protein
VLAREKQAQTHGAQRQQAHEPNTFSEWCGHCKIWPGFPANDGLVAPTSPGEEIPRQQVHKLYPELYRLSRQSIREF